jgi:peptide/nickel transport system ATP-binding protein
MAGQKDIFLKVTDLRVNYTQSKKTVQAVNGVSFSVDRGITLGIAGETGAGKTTIAKAIMGILPNPPAKIAAGEIWFDGSNLLKKNNEEMLKIRGRKIAMIFQDPMTALNPLMTVGDQISEVLLLHNDYDKHKSMEETGKMLEIVGIPAERYVEYPHQFSGGMKQRVVIAMALACNPELILADEPTTALDVTIQAQILELIKDLKNKFRTSMILITHDLGIIAETCDNVAIVYAGRIVERGTKSDIFRNPLHPYTVGLFNSLPDMTGEETRLKPIGGMPPDPTDLPKGCAFNPRCPLATGVCRDGEIPEKEIASGHFCACILKGNG